MPHRLTWTPTGACRRYVGAVTVAERSAPFDGSGGDARSDAPRHGSTDDLDVASDEVPHAATAEIAALHEGPLATGPRVLAAAVATRPDLIAATRALERHGLVSAPHEGFPTVDDAGRGIDEHRLHVPSSAVRRSTLR